MKSALLSKICFVLGFASIIGSIVIWYTTGGEQPEIQAHAERFGIFVGLWAPTFLILSGLLNPETPSSSNGSNPE
jgi:hypothetical protein